MRASAPAAPAALPPRKPQMKLYFHPVSTTSRPIVAFAADHDLNLEYQVVDLMVGEHVQPAFTALNPSQQVPLLDDSGFLLTESSAILKYLGDKLQSPAYPTEPRQRARVHELMDWFNTGLYRDLNYGVVYPQIFGHLKREDAAVQAANLAWHGQRARRWVGILDQHLLGTKPWLTGDAITLADYLGGSMISSAETLGADYADFPNVRRWLAALNARPGWAKASEAFYTYLVTPLKGKPFTTF
jgi:glutathione S-transferase